MRVEAREASDPEAAMEVEPIRRRGKRLGLEPAPAMFAVSLVGNQRRFFQHLQMPRDRRERNIEGLRQFPHGCLTLSQADENRPASRVGEGVEGVVQRVHLTAMLIHILVKSRWTVAQEADGPHSSGNPCSLARERSPKGGRSDYADSEAKFSTNITVASAEMASPNKWPWTHSEDPTMHAMAATYTGSDGLSENVMRHSWRA